MRPSIESNSGGYIPVDMLNSEKEKKCIFCEIVSGSSPSSKIYETDKVLAFSSLSGYPLIAPKEHFDNIFDERLDKDTIDQLAETEVQIAKAVRSAFQVNAVNIISANGEEAGQEVGHYHIHVIPRVVDDNQIRLGKETVLSRDILDQRAELVRISLNELVLPGSEK